VSLLTKGVSTLSQLLIDADKDWAGHLIKNLGAPVDDADALRRGDALLRSLLTSQGQVIYAAGPGVPAVLDPPAAQKYLRHPGGAAAPEWADVAGALPWDDYHYYCHFFDSVDGIEHNGSSGYYVSAEYSQLRLQTGTGSNYWVWAVLAHEGLPHYVRYAQDAKWRVLAKVLDSINVDVYLVFGHTDTTSWPAGYPPSTMGFRLKEGRIYAYCHDGSDHTAVELGSFSAFTDYAFSIEYTAQTRAVFKVVRIDFNSVVGTEAITTNFPPPSASINFGGQFGINNLTTGLAARLWISLVEARYERRVA